MLSKNKIIDLLKSKDDKVFQEADNIRKKYVGDRVHLRGLIEFSNFCHCTCWYCGLRFANSNLYRYRLSEDEILTLAQRGKSLGLQTIVLQSGEDLYFNSDKICRIVEGIKKLDVAVTLSLGEKSYEEYERYKNAGADRYLLRIETTDKALYESLHPNMSYENRIECLYNLKSLGYETGTGSLVGLPNQTLESLADDILFYKELDADMVGIGPFIPHPDTPLWDSEADLIHNLDLSLRVMAISRILLKNVNIPATTAMETIHPEGRILALNSGANVVMPNLTDEESRKNYSIYPDKNCTDLEVIKSMLATINRPISTDKGFRLE